MPQHDFDLTSLRLFVAVCEQGNIARVAEREHMVSSAISKRMAQLEQQCASALLERRRYGVQPTPAGETLLAYARELLATSRKLQEAMHAYSTGVRGQVRVLANASIMTEALAEDVVAFMQQRQHANIRIDIEERHSPAVISGIREGSATLGVVWDRANLQGLHHVPYRCDHLGVVVHRQHPLAGQRRVALADTLDWDHVGLPANSAIQQLFEQTALAHGKRLRSKVIVANHEAAMRMAQAQLAICVVPQELFASTLNQHQLLHIPLSDAWATRQFVLCFKDPAQLSAAAKALVEHLQGCAG